MAENAVRVRFAPSPTGYLHVGGARTALFNWQVARKEPGGRFILRIEDTDQSRHVADSVDKILADLRWLGLDGDEGPEVGGDFGPYFQSQRLAIYQEHVQRLLDAGRAYYALETPEELAAMREAGKSAPGGYKYPRPDPLPTPDQVQAARDAGKPVVVRLMMDRRDVTVTDQILGQVTLPAAELEDFVIQKHDGWPTYHLACVVDDALMRITHVLRGQEHLMNTPKHIALQQALGFDTPTYAHLPVIYNADGSKMSKRDKEKAIKRGEKPPEIDVHDFRQAGYLPEALLNFLSLLGWSSGDDTEQMDLQETVRRFELSAIGRGNARFDREKLLAFNTDWAARLEPSRLLAHFKDFAAVAGGPFADQPDKVLEDVLRCCAGFRTFRDVVAKSGFAFTQDQDITYDEKAVRKILDKNDGAGFAMLDRLVPVLEQCEPWTAHNLERVLKEFAENADVKFGQVAQPIRVALTGTTVSPAIGDALALTGKERSLRRIRTVLARRQVKSSGS